ncbi:MAG: hypothetical protein HY302_07755 [Opitutae bacterium]|nr:hypothetical protein [Opitutae bacterium]
MAASLSFFARRRLGLILALVAAGLVAWGLHHLYGVLLRFTAITTGLVLLGTCFALAFFNARKKLPFIPLLRASTWLQFHVYAGWFAVILFVLHIEGRWPAGIFEVTLAAVFALVALSGVFGILISRVLPGRLALSGENVMYERIPALRTKLQRDVEALVWKSVEETKSFTISEFYTNRLKAYFDRPRHRYRHLLASKVPLQKLLSEVRLLERYMVPAERLILAEISECIAAKDNLDLQWAGQGLLKYWLFVHIPLTFSLLILGLLHGLLAFSFAGGVR